MLGNSIFSSSDHARSQSSFTLHGAQDGYCSLGVREAIYFCCQHVSGAALGEGASLNHSGSPFWQPPGDQDYSPILYGRASPL